MFWEAAAANFLGSLFAGSIIAIAVWSLITRRYEVVKPLAERRDEQRLVCSMISRELDQFRYSANSLLPNDRFFEGRIYCHAWEALKGSQPLRSLPVGLLEPVLNAYSGIYAVNHLIDRIEQAEILDWGSGSHGGAALYVKNSKAKALQLAQETGKDCKKAVNTLQAHLENLPKS